MTITALYVDAELAHAPEVASIRDRLNLSPIPVETSAVVFDAVSADPDPIRKGKELLYLTRNRGAFLRQCPGTRHYTCCGYQILHIGTYCVMDCAYCVLQTYFHPPVLQYFINHDAMTAELTAAFAAPHISRIGTGEFTDSLIWDRWTDLSARLVTAFSGQNRAVLELKTKTATVAPLRHLDHNRKTIVSWSLNSESVIGRQERRTASIDARLAAAAQCVEWGYPVAFHLDPMVITDGAMAEYPELVERIFDRVPPESVVWMSLGTFRFMPDLKAVIERRFASSTLPYGEFIPGLDGKMRYFKPLRIALYRQVASAIRRRASGVTLYLCMEDGEVWDKALGFRPGDLSALLDESAAAHCGLDTRLLRTTGG